MTTLASFKRPKDPQSTRWFTIRFDGVLAAGETLASIAAQSVTCTVSTNPDVPSGQGEWTTPGDAVTGSPLVASMAQLTADSLGVSFKLAAGVPGLVYAVTAYAIDSNGDAVNGTIILRCGGQ